MDDKGVFKVGIDNSNITGIVGTIVGYHDRPGEVITEMYRVMIMDLGKWDFFLNIILIQAVFTITISFYTYNSYYWKHMPL